MERKIIVILGPTASGKTAIGVRVAKEFNGEIISADSRQVFRGLDLGSGKEGSAKGGQVESRKSKVEKELQTPDSKLQTLRNAQRFVEGVPQWLIDIKNPGEDFNLFEFIELANLAIENIFLRGKTPVVVGGTGLYIQGLVEGFKLSKMSNVKCLPHRQAGRMSNVDREQLNNRSLNCESRIKNHESKTRTELELLTKEELKDILRKLDKDVYAKVDKNNPHRLIRAIERAQDGYEMIKVKPDFEALQIGINWPREILNKRIDKRVDDRFDQGMLEEVAGLLKQGVGPEWLTKLGLEYREITKFLLMCHSRENGNLDPRVKPDNLPSTRSRDDKLDQIKKSQEFRDMSKILKLRIRQFAKRQTTWFKRFPEIVWENENKKINQIIKDYL